MDSANVARKTQIKCESLRRESLMMSLEDAEMIRTLNPLQHSMNQMLSRRKPRRWQPPKSNAKPSTVTNSHSI